jgi:RNA polymerase sigma factor (sigma-70 family)
VNEDLEQLKAERILISTIRRGDAQGWGGIYDMYASRLFRSILMPRLCEPLAAEDALADTFRVAIERIGSFEDQGHGIYPWLCRIAHNKAMDMHRASKVTGRKLNDITHLLVPLNEPVPGADELLVLNSRQGRFTEYLQMALSELIPRYRAVIELRFLQELSRETCAEQMGVKLSTFDVLLLRALRALRAAWAEVVPPSSGARQ